MQEESIDQARSSRSTGLICDSDSTCSFIFFIKLLVYLYSKSGPGTLVCQSSCEMSNHYIKLQLMSLDNDGMHVIICP